ncbi:hypothetical protein [Paenibacillus amylolyticus]|uniref:hypothetical protein n=1 Tax=Paenibacillus amylolyticus TaxID=1451 RepID=UPI0015C4F014|nr:hypothetical protein [Paenibacillus amylolyticus]
MTKVEKTYQQEKEQALKEQAYEFAKKMLSDLAPDKIAEITGLPIEEVNILKQN